MDGDLIEFYLRLVGAAVLTVAALVAVAAFFAGRLLMAWGW